MTLYAPINSFVENLRKLFKNRVKDGRKAYLGDGTGRCEVPDRLGYYYYRFELGGSPSIARSGNASFPVYEGSEVYIAIGYNDEPEIVGAVYQRLDQSGVDTRTFNQMHQQSKWVYLWQITIGQTIATATSTTNSLLVSVKKHLTYFNNTFSYFETGEEADKFDFTPYPTAADEHRYALVWRDAYGNVGEITASTAQSLFMPLDIGDVNEATAQRPPDGVPYKAFVLANNGNTLRQSITEIDLRQFLNVPQTWGFPNPVAYRERIHPDRQVLFAGSQVVTGSLEVLGSLVGIGDGGGGSSISTPVTIANGGTGQTSQTPAFDALAPTTTKGDLIVHNGTDNIRLARGADGSGLISDPDAASGVSWSQRPLLMQMRLGLGTDIAAGAVKGSGSSVVTLAPYAGDMLSLWDDATGFWRDYNGAPNGVGDIGIDLSPFQTGTRSNGFPEITALTDTSVLIVGMLAVGAGIPGSTTILSIDSSTQITLSANATSSGTASISFDVPASTMFDIFAYQSTGDVKLELVYWTNDTTRAVAIDQTTTRTIIKDGVPTHRYLGTGYTSVAGSINGWHSMSNNRLGHLWSLYYRVPIMLHLIDSTDSWPYTSSTIRQARADATNQFDVIAGLDEVSPIHVNLTAGANTVGAVVGVGVDSTTTFDSNNIGKFLIANGLITTHYVGYVPLGRHIYSWNEKGIAGNSFLGDSGGANLQSGMVGTTEG